MNKKYLILLIFFCLFFIFPMLVYYNNDEKPKQIVHKNKEELIDVKELYITIFPDYLFKGINSNENFSKKEDIKHKILFQEGENGDCRQGFFGYGLTDPNGTITVSKQEKTSQISYKIELNKRGGLWNGFKIIYLNKAPSNILSVGNKLSHDSLKKIKNITSLRTQFIHLYIKDFSQGNFRDNYQDYGLYIHIENIDKDFLKNNQLDSKGWLYAAKNFEFNKYPNQLKLKDDLEYNKNKFEKILEIKGNNNHNKLLQMLGDVNNSQIPINQVIDKHFNRENYLTWLAVNILMGNVNSNSQDFYLYSPRQGNIWYFLPGDFNEAWGKYEQIRGRDIAPWQVGISNYWGNALHRRFLENKSNLDELTKKIEMISTMLSQKEIRALLNVYEPIVMPFLIREHDNQNGTITEEIYEEINKLTKVIEINKQHYYQNLEKPMPVHMANAFNHGLYLIFKWSQSYDIQNDNIHYCMDISDSPDFESILVRQDNVKETECIVNNLPPGIYYWRLIIKDSKGNTQVPFNFYQNEDGKRYYGVQEILVQ